MGVRAIVVIMTARWLRPVGLLTYVQTQVAQAAVISGWVIVAQGGHEGPSTQVVILI